MYPIGNSSGQNLGKIECCCPLAGVGGKISSKGVGSDVAAFMQLAVPIVDIDSSPVPA